MRVQRPAAPVGRHCRFKGSIPARIYVDRSKFESCHPEMPTSRATIARRGRKLFRSNDNRDEIITRGFMIPRTR